VTHNIILEKFTLKEIGAQIKIASAILAYKNEFKGYNVFAQNALS